MTSTELLSTLLETTVASSAAIVLVLLLRGPVRAWLGASASYLLWLMLPTALLAVLLPGPQLVAVPMLAVGTPLQVAAQDGAGANLVTVWPQWLLCAWLAGALLMALRLLAQQRRFRKALGVLQQRSDGLWQAQSSTGLPAAMGLLRPMIVLPTGFEQRYSPLEQQLVLLHERIHLQRGDIAINAVLALLQCLYWFNPLLLLAQRRCREDQELSCDERVIAQMAGVRRSYGDAMLKTGLAQSALPVGCHWQNHHPLKERIAMLKRPVPGKKQWLAMLVLSVTLSTITGYAAWAAQPGRTAVTALSEAGTVYMTRVQANADDTQQQFELHQSAGTPFAFTLESANGVAWSAEFTLVPADAGKLRLQGTLKADGALVSSPDLLVMAGKPAAVEVTTPGGSSLLALQLLISEVGDNPQTASAGKISVEPEAGEGDPTTDLMTPPAYPKAAVENSVSGKVVLRIEVNAEGRATDVKVETSQPQGVFDAAAVEAVRKWKFNPAQKDGKAVAGAVRVPIWFDLDENVTHTEEGTGS
ncbi:TonB family protein [Stenotrophomonas sp. JC08]|uniref:TonB family protein n=1 Tax=Stenotrophomonas sp. JC08 TaxID=3445779 RepID=UPI003FA28EED